MRINGARFVPKQKWRFLDLGPLDPVDTQCIYDAVGIARGRDLVVDTIIFCYPSSPLVCIGYHQEVEKEVDIAVCQQLGIPVVRRILGGGAVYLDTGQLFYQIAVSQKNPIIPRQVENAFKVLLQGPVEAYRSLGIPVEYRSINDIQVEGRKISGNGATTTVDNVLILTGNLILDFNYDMMVKILRVPSEKFRDKMFKSLQTYLTTAKRELGRSVPLEEAKKALAEGFAKALGISLQRGSLKSEEKQIVQKLRKKYLTNEWLYMPEYRHPKLTEARVVKVATGIAVAESVYKSKGGLIRVTLELDGKKISDILISGDFWLYPPDSVAKLEQTLKGATIDKDEITNRIRAFYDLHKIESPGTTPEDFSTAVLMATEKGEAI